MEKSILDKKVTVSENALLVLLMTTHQIKKDQVCYSLALMSLLNTVIPKDVQLEETAAYLDMLSLKQISLKVVQL